MAGWIPWEEENLPTLPGAPQHMSTGSTEHMSTLQGLVSEHMSTGSSTANALAHDSTHTMSALRILDRR